MRPPPHAGGSTAHEPAQKHPSDPPAKKSKKKHKKSKKKLDFWNIVWYNNVTVSSIARTGHSFLTTGDSPKTKGKKYV